MDQVSLRSPRGQDTEQLAPMVSEAKATLSSLFVARHIDLWYLSYPVKGEDPSSSGASIAPSRKKLFQNFRVSDMCASNPGAVALIRKAIGELATAADSIFSEEVRRG